LPGYSGREDLSQAIHPDVDGEQRQKRIFEYAEFIALREQFAPELQGVLTFGYYTGWRKNEILSLRWNQVDLNNQTVRLDPGTTKSGEGRTVILEGELLELIKQQWERRAIVKIPGTSPTVLCAYVFHRRGKPIKDFYDAWRKACTAAGIQARIFHDFRRTAVRNMVRVGVPERVAMMVSGHKTCSVPPDSEHWISESEMAIDRLENQLGGTDGQTKSVERGEALPDCQRSTESKRAHRTNSQTAPGFRRVDLPVAG
jgi:integrase